MAHPHHWLPKNYSQPILTYNTRILLLDLTYGCTMDAESVGRKEPLSHGVQIPHGKDNFERKGHDLTC